MEDSSQRDSLGFQVTAVWRVQLLPRNGVLWNETSLGQCTERQVWMHH